MDEEIEQLRRVVDATDERLARYLAVRLDAVLAIAARKRALGIPIHDPEREREICERVPPEVRDAYRAVVVACREAAENQPSDGEDR